MKLKKPYEGETVTVSGVKFSQYNPVLKHYYPGFNQIYLSEWLRVFHGVLDDILNSDQFLVWKNISNKMGKGLLTSNEMIRIQKNEYS